VRLEEEVTPMFLEGLLNRGSMPVLQQVMSFTQERHRVLANNISNLDTVGYKMQDLPESEFFVALDEAILDRDRGGAGRPLRMRSTSNLHWDQAGHLHAEPVEIENNNILFHDGNNRFVEKQMSEMAQNAILHNVSAELLRGQYELLRMAIRERM